MPHLSELQRKHADDGVTIIAVTKEDPRNSLEAVRKMTAEKGDTMAFTVAFDDGGKTYASYMTASGQRGIPTSFLVDKQGKIAYIGHPMNMDVPLAMVAAGTWDPIEGPKEMKAMQDLGRKIAIGARSATSETAPALLELVDEYKRRWPGMAANVRMSEFTLLGAAGKHAEAGALGRELVSEAIADKDTGTLNAIAWGIVDPEAKLEHRDVSLALWAATVASNLKQDKDPAILDTLARAHFWLGGLDRAIELQAKAVAIIEEDPKSYGGMASGIKAALDEYRQAKGGTL